MALIFSSVSSLAGVAGIGAPLFASLINILPRTSPIGLSPIFARSSSTVNTVL